ncbi:MAG: NAD(P)H-dependent oxidoreductase, partial [candidate division WOR-3 bacterium]
LDDDLYRLLDIIQDADRLLLVAPVYILSMPGKLKMFLDRYLAIAGYLTVHGHAPAASIGVAALAEWHQFQVPLMNILLLALKRRIVESHIVYGAGPGEILLNGRIADLPGVIDRLVNFEHKDYVSLTSKVCPVDFSNLFEFVEGDLFRCPVCLTPARLTAEGYYFDASDLNKHRWTEQKLQDHFENWILKTKPRFKSMLSEIVRKKGELGL